MQKYVDDILSDEDKPLFEEAVKAFDAGIYRAAYIMFWLSCVESIKRRFREASQRDGNAQQIVGEIDRKAAAHQSVDKFLLSKAKEYGFISDSSYTILENIYALRCVYGHPYEEAPKEEQVINAAAMVVEHVLSKPVKLKHGFAELVLKKLLESEIFLDDNKYAIEQFVKDFLQKIDESIYSWFLEKYWKKLEEISEDATMTLFFNRGISFSLSIVKHIEIDSFFEKWHDWILAYPRILIHVCSKDIIFKNMDLLAQDTLIGAILKHTKRQPKILSSIENLYNKDMLSERQKERFTEKISKLKIDILYSSGLSTSICYNILMEELKSHNWYQQNDAVNFIVSNGPEQVAMLSDEQQTSLGRNILQCAEGGANAAKEFLFDLRYITLWSSSFKLGIILETFINEERKIRFKLNNINRILSMSEVSAEMIRDVSRLVLRGRPKEDVDYRDFQRAIKILEGHTGWNELKYVLKEHAKRLKFLEENE